MNLKDAIEYGELFIDQLKADQKREPVNVIISTKVGTWSFVNKFDIGAVKVLLEFAKENRWRELSEERPPSEMEMYEVWLEFPDGSNGPLHLYWHNRQGDWSFGTYYRHIIFWRPIVGPKKSTVEEKKL